MSNLYIYKASAGSGKTYRLAVQYLEILFKDPYTYRHILAVTFTNKAAGEMKGRIIKELSLLSRGGSDLLNELCRTLKLTPEEVRKKALHILDLILNDFSRFSIGTIDSFFQLIIRSFTREANLQGSYKLELNSLEILAEATDNLLFELDKNEVLRKWLIRYAEEIIQSGKTFNLTKEIINLGNELFKETYRSLYRDFETEILDEEKIKEYSGMIRKIKYSFQHRMKEFGRDFMEAAHRSDLVLNDFKNGSKSFAQYFKKIVYQTKNDWYDCTDRVKNAVDNPDEWYAKKSDKSEVIMKAYEGGLNSILKDTVNYVDGNIREYSTALAIDRFTYAFGILFDLSRHIRQILKERNLFLLSDSSQFLNEIIGKNETPFIYEKAGIYYKNFMLDEFQDTSGFQWENFKPLIDNSLSQGYDNLIVGDVKQSIYRWRNSDWQILDSEIKQAFPEYYKERSLRENWRSRENIVLFNNMVFSESADTVKSEFLSSLQDEDYQQEEIIRLSEKIGSAYQDVNQTLPEGIRKDGGYVKLCFLSPGLNKTGIHEEIRNRLPGLICDLQDRGYNSRDIGILVRDGKDGKSVASILLDYKKDFLAGNSKYNFNVISNDSLYVTNNSAVQFIIALLRQIRDSTDSLNEAFLIHEFNRYIMNGQDVPEDLHYIFEKSLRSKCLSFGKIYAVYMEELKNVLHLSLYELVEKIILLFHLNENSGDLPYIQAFQDIILAFMQKESSDISSFIEYWDEAGSAETLNISEQQDAIKIMTIHKSKGLEFKIVIIPFCDWHLDHEAVNKINVLWCRANIKPFDYLPFVPVNYSRILKNTLFSGEYQTERIHAFVDNLNLLYVAFTRAKEELHIFSPLSDNKEKKLVHMGDVLFAILNKLPDPDTLKYKKTEDEGTITCECGLPGRSEPSGDESDQSEIFKNYTVNSLSGNLKIRYHGSEYFSTDINKPGSIEQGVIMHEILSRVKTMKDLPSSVKKACNEGKIEQSEKQDIIRLLEDGFSKAVPPEMFEQGWKLYTERDILTPKGNYRPDRMMLRGTSAIIIDYKFGKEIRTSYSFQVRNYMRWIKETGYDHVKAYVWYFLLGKVEEVSDEK